MAGNISMSLRVSSKLDAVKARFPGAVDTIMAAGGERTIAYAKANHPWQNRTGQTEASPHMEKTGEHAYTLIFGGASIFLEYGTVHMPPYSWIRPAIAATQDSIAQGFTKLGSYL